MSPACSGDHSHLSTEKKSSAPAALSHSAEAVQHHHLDDETFKKTSHMGVSLNGGTPNLHTKMIIFSRKTKGCWVPSF